jgi:chromosomal replication initiator protein
MRIPWSREGDGMIHDSRMTFETFVVGPANRLAFAAARRSAESPGASYNPLFLYSASGLGKSHILSAIAQHALRGEPGIKVVYQTLEGYLDDLMRDLERGVEDDVRVRYSDADILLLDDVQFLTGQGQAQEMLLRTLDEVASRKGQVVLASDRPPAEIDGLDERLLSRFSGGLIVDIGQPDYETRVAIMQRKVEERGGNLAEGVARAMARFPFRNVRELQGALNRILAVQDLEERSVAVEELPVILGGGDEDRVGEFARAFGGHEEDGSRGSPGSGKSPAPMEEPEWRRAFREAAEAVEVAGFSAHRLHRLLERTPEGGEPEGWRGILDAFHADVERVRSIRRELDDLGNPWPDAAAAVLRDPDRLDDAEALVSSARERARPFPDLPSGSGLEGVSGTFPALAIRAAERVLAGDRPEYNPLYLHSPSPGRARSLLEAIGRTFRARRPSARIGFISVRQFSDEFIRAISDGVAGAWRERWWTVDLLLLHGVEDLSNTERSQEEFFHLFEALKRRGARVVLAADRRPSAIQGVDDRLRSRFEGGLVTELGRGRDGEGDPRGETAGADATRTGSRESDGEEPGSLDGPRPPGEVGLSGAAQQEVEPRAHGSSDSDPEGQSPEGRTGNGSRDPGDRKGPAPQPRESAAPASSPKREGVGITDVGRGEEVLAALRAFAGIGTEDTSNDGSIGLVQEALNQGRRQDSAEAEEEGEDHWFPSPEKVVWVWRGLEERIVDDESRESLP